MEAPIQADTPVVERPADGSVDATAAEQEALLERLSDALVTIACESAGA